jgi:gas vesicle protein
MKAQNVLIGALSGLVAGVALGILIAPAEGKETRQRLADTADTLRRKLKHLRGVTADELDELREIVEREAEGMKEDVKARILELIRAAKQRGNNIKEQAFN